ncbi:MAG: PEP-CTERM sorting domain-containing protein, partial [Fimbriiglobus sp.]
SNSTARLFAWESASHNPRLDNVSIGNNVLAFPSNSEFELTNGVTFAPGTTFSMGFSSFLQLGTGQTMLANVAITTGNNTHIFGTMNSTTWTIANTASIQNTSSTGTGYIGSLNGAPTGTARSVVNNGTIWNSGAGTTQIDPSGNFTNNGLVLATAGTIRIRPQGTFVIGAGSTLRTEGAGVILIETSNVSNGGTVNAQQGTLDINPTTTTTYSNITGGSTAIGTVGAATMNVGNSNSSVLNNAGIVDLRSGSVINIGNTGANRGTFNNTAGTTTINGTLNSRTTTFSGGDLTGSGTIQGITGTRALLLTSSATLKPGNSPGQITIGGGLDINSGLEIEISGGGGNNSTTVGNTTAGGGFDTVRNTPVDGNPSDIIVRTALSIRLVVESANLGTAFWAAPQSWQIMSTSNGSVIFSSGVPGDPVTNIGIPTPTVFMLEAGTQNTINPLITYPQSLFTFSITNQGNENRLMLNWNPVPEPTTILAFGALPLAALAWRRRQRG